MSPRRESRAALIGALVEGLEPVANPGRTLRLSLAWLTAACVASIGIMLAVGPFRLGFGEQLLTTPRFALESCLGIAVIALATLAAFKSAIPSAQKKIALLSLPLVCFAAWLGFYFYGLLEPALTPSMAGKRDHCVIEVLLYGLPALALGIITLRRLYSLQGVYSGALLGLAAGAIPALLMQFACMYLVPHILTHHLLPVFAVALVGALAGSMALRPR